MTMLDPLLLVAFVGMLMVCVLVGLAVFDGGGGRLRRRAGRVAKAANGLVSPQARVAAASTIRRGGDDGTRVGAFENLARRYLPRQSVLRDRLARTGHRISLAAYMTVNVGVVAVVLLATWGGLGLPLVLSALIAVIGGLGLPHLGVGVLAGRRRKRFVALLPDAIDLMVRGLRSGLPIGQSIAAAGAEIPDPVGSELRQIMDAVRLGQNMDEVLAETARRLDIAEVNFFVISLAIQRETGGNLAETLSNLSDIVRRRRQMRLKIKALSGEAKASAMILGSLPFIMFAIVSLMNPDYAFQLFDDPRGLVMVVMGGGSLLMGIAVMAKMVRFEI